MTGTICWGQQWADTRTHDFHTGVKTDERRRKNDGAFIYLVFTQNFFLLMYGHKPQSNNIILSLNRDDERKRERIKKWIKDKKKKIIEIGEYEWTKENNG